MQTKWSEELAEFLESLVVFESVPNRSNNSPVQQFPRIERITNISDVPLRIVACSNFNGMVVYLCEWRGDSTKYVVPSTVARTKFPNLVIGFLETKLNFNDTKWLRQDIYGNNILRRKLRQSLSK